MAGSDFTNSEVKNTRMRHNTTISLIFEMAFIKGISKKHLCIGA
uniref:Uncharacterized protein n=1 Tax=Siphoviridae sp. ctkkB9 TaxID=2825644 RepID=A0A8S5TZH7_9CAUD|nr:MAG TPA: hypothetical protein [Siphoviridae sp. ctkkB9]DAZ32198.1 MAG TPA: hypothetical protein [Caudoviricetes sp.]